jgi:metallo-beta-lactamase class B
MPRRLSTRLPAWAFAAAFAACASPAALAKPEPKPDPRLALIQQANDLLHNSLCPAMAGDTPFPPRWTEGDPHIAPMQVFDNLYFVGSRKDTAWALTTSDGIILFDAMFADEVEEFVVGGLKSLGLDPAQIKYVVVSHAHADHFGGAAYLQAHFGAKVAMSNTDWHMLPRPRREETKDTKDSKDSKDSKESKDSGERAPLPHRDLTILSGDTLTLGDTTIRFIETPGHTPGSLSSLIPLKEGGETHLGALWGGTALNNISSEDVEVYLRSLESFRTVDPKIDVALSNHAYVDGAELKMAALKARKPGEPHPFVLGNVGFQDWTGQIQQCAEQWLGKKKREGKEE